ncbi:hypothetical protein ABH920_005684 [Catenulispora sp. EB89]
MRGLNAHYNLDSLAAAYGELREAVRPAGSAAS